MALTLKWLEQNATDKSFERGEDIYENQEIVVLKKGDIYMAEVYGSSPYQVEIQDTTSEILTSCTCPYDWGGICKHIVAVGLAILDEDYEEEKAESIIPAAKNNVINVNHFLEKVFGKADIQTQQAFLRQLFTQNPTFISQFEAFIKTEAAPIDIKNITSISEKVSRALSKIPLDIEDSPGFDYGEEDDGYDWAMEKVERKLNPFHQQAKEILNKGKLEEFMLFQIGVYEGLLKAEEPIYNDDYGDIFGNYVEILQQKFVEDMKGSFPILEKMIIPDATAKACIDLLLDRTDFYHKSDSLNMYDLQDWEPFCLYILQSEATARHLLARLKDFPLYLREVPQLMMKAAKILGDTDKWVETAITYCANNKEISSEILHYFQAKQDFNGIVNVVNRIFTEEKYPNTTFLLNYLRPEMDKALYINVLKADIKANRKIAQYQRFAEMASEDERLTLIEEVKLATYDSFFYAQMLAYEQQYERVLGLLGNLYRTKDAPPYLALIVVHLPEKTWEWTKNWVTKSLEEGIRSRENYTAFAKCMALFLAIPDYKQKAKTLATGILSLYPRLSALREEFKAVKLM